MKDFVRRQLAFSIPVAALDIYALISIAILINQPRFDDIDPTKLPGLHRSQPTSTSAALPAGHRIEVKADGQISFDGKPMPLTELPETILQTGHGAPIYLSLETDELGTGPVQSLIRIQIRLSEAGLWNRVELLTNPATPPEDDSQPEQRKMS